MKLGTDRILSVVLLCVLASIPAAGGAYNAQPKLVVVIVIDQLRPENLERGRANFTSNGFRLFMDRGAYFTNCSYDYANTVTAPGHATLFTGSYTNGHGILANEWWDPEKKRIVSAVADDATTIVGLPGGFAGVSPRNLLSDTLGDELKLATGGKSRVFSTSFKDRAAVLSAGFAADGVFWTDPTSGAWVTSSFYAPQLPKWVERFNADQRVGKYWNLQWKDASGKVLRDTKRSPGGKFFDIIGPTPFGIDYQFEFARELVTNEKLGTGPATDLLVVSLSTPDLVGHQLGPDSSEVQQLLIETDSKLGEFFAFLGRQIGLANIWIALSADHGVSPSPEYATSMRIPASHLDNGKVRRQLNAALSARFNVAAEYVADVHWPNAYLAPQAFAGLKMSEGDAERAVGEALVQFGMRGYFTKSQLAGGNVPAGEAGRKYLHSYSPYSGWYVLGVPKPFQIAASGATHGSGFSYDTKVPLAFFGLPFQPGTYHSQAEPVDLAVTLASLLGIGSPAEARGRVLTEALTSRPARPAAVRSGATQ